MALRLSIHGQQKLTIENPRVTGSAPMQLPKQKKPRKLQSLQGFSSLCFALESASNLIAMHIKHSAYSFQIEHMFNLFFHHDRSFTINETAIINFYRKFCNFALFPSVPTVLSFNYLIQ